MTEETKDGELYPHVFLINEVTKDAIANRLPEDTVAEYLGHGYKIVDIDTFYKAKDRFFKLSQARIKKSEKQRLRRMQYGRE